MSDNQMHLELDDRNFDNITIEPFAIGGSTMEQWAIEGYALYQYLVDAPDIHAHSLITYRALYTEFLLAYAMILRIPALYPTNDSL